MQSKVPSVIRIKPIQYIHVLDNNTNVTRTEIGPQTFTKKDHETIVAGPLNMVIVPPQCYVVIADPAKRDKDGNICYSKEGQVQLKLGDSEIRFSGKPFPLYYGEKQVGQVSPLKTLLPNVAFHLIATRDFVDVVDGKEVKRLTGDEWLFVGPGTYIPRIEVDIKEVVKATIISKGTALRLKALRSTVDCNGVKRQCGEEWLVRRPGAYLPSVDETVVRIVNPSVVTKTLALKLRALKNFTDVYKVHRKVGEEWLVTSDMTDSHIPDIYEEIIGNVPITVLSENDYCVVLDPVDEHGVPQLGKKEVRKGETTFFLKPGESLEDNQVKHAFILSPDEGLLLKAFEAIDDHQPGDRWMEYGPKKYIPSAEVEVIEKRSYIPLDKNEGVYVRDIKTGHVREEIGKSYMLKAFEELCEKELPEVVEKLLQKNVRVEGAEDNVVPKRDKTRVVTLQLPHNSACQIYDYKEKKARVILGPELVTLGYNEQFTVLSLSGGKPKVNHQIKTIVLLLGPDFTSDIIQVDTSDHAKLELKVSYKWQFIYDENNLYKLFSHPDFVGDMCKTMASRIRSLVANTPFDIFHKNSAQIIEEAAFGKGNKKFLIETNSLEISSVDIQSVELVDQKTRSSLMKSVQLAIEITTQSQEAKARHEANKLEEKAKGELVKTKIIEETKAEDLRQKLLEKKILNNEIEVTGNAEAQAKARIEAERIESQAAVEEARLKYEAAKIRISTEKEIRLAKHQFKIEHIKKLNEIELKTKEQLAQIEADKFKNMISSIGADTIKAIASAGPEMQAKLLKGLGLSSVLITDGSSPINLFNTAKGLITPKAIDSK